MKDLTINNKIFAIYEVDLEKDCLFLKILINIFPDNPMHSEDIIIAIIENIEEKKFRYAGYLNV